MAFFFVQSRQRTASSRHAAAAAHGSHFHRPEGQHREALERARDCAKRLHRVVAKAVERFHAGAAETGAPHLRIEVSDIRVDDKHVRAVEFNLVRGRHKAVVIAKGRGEVTLVGPFHVGKTEGPCRSFPFEAEDEIREALGSFVERFAEAAVAP